MKKRSKYPEHYTAISGTYDFSAKRTVNLSEFLSSLDFFGSFFIKKKRTVRTFDLLADSCESSTQLTGFNAEAGQVIREVAATETRAAIHAQTVLAIAFGETFDRIPDEITDSSGKTSPGKEKLPVANRITIYPNPAANNLTIRFNLSDPFHVGKFIVYNILGEQLREFDLSNNNQDIILNTGDFRNGIYYYKLVLDSMVKEEGKIAVIR